MGSEAIERAQNDTSNDPSASESQEDSHRQASSAKGDSQPAPSGDASSGGARTLLTLAEAARTVGLSERALRKHIQRGRLTAQTMVRNGRAIAAVEVDELKRRYGTLEMVPTATVAAEGEGGARGTRLRSTRELSQRKRLRVLERTRTVLEARLAKLRALLGMERAQKLEMQRQMQFLADSLARAEARLDTAHEEGRRLSLELGLARGQAEELRRGLAALHEAGVQAEPTTHAEAPLDAARHSGADPALAAGRRTTTVAG